MPVPVLPDRKEVPTGSLLNFPGLPGAVRLILKAKVADQLGERVEDNLLQVRTEPPENSLQRLPPAVTK